MIEQDNNGMKTPWTELELGNSCYSSYIVEPIFVPKETAFWLCRPDGTREASRLTFAVFSQRGTDEWEDDPMLGPIDVTLLDDDNIRPFPTLYLGVAPEDFIHLKEEDEENATFSFHWIEGDITSAQGEETVDGLRFRKSLFEGGKTVALKLTPYDGTPFVLHLRIPVKGFQLLDADERPQQGELVVDPATAKEYQYQFVGTPNDDRFTIAINGGLHILLCIWQEDDTLTLRDHKNGLAVVGTKGATARSLNKLMADCEGKPENNLIQMVALRAMMKAKYSVHNIGHFGLAFEYYTHFTSPIRRYPDTMVHRLLTKYAQGGRSANEKHYEELCEHCSDMEQIAQNAERDSIKYKMVEFMGDKLGEEFDAHISGITSYGIYATIDENHCEGMIPMRDIADDYYDFDEKNFCLIGRRHHNKYQLGDAIRIKVAQANLEKKQLDFALAGDSAPIRKEKPEASTSSKKTKKSKQKTRNHRRNK